MQNCSGLRRLLALALTEEKMMSTATELSRPPCSMSPYCQMGRLQVQRPAQSHLSTGGCACSGIANHDVPLLTPNLLQACTELQTGAGAVRSGCLHAGLTAQLGKAQSVIPIGLPSSTASLQHVIFAENRFSCSKETC